MHSARTNTALIVTAVLAVGMLLVAVGAYAWIFTEVRSTVADVSLKAEETQLLTTQNAHTQTVRRVVRDTEASRAELNSFFVTEEGLVQFLEDIEAIGEDIGVRLIVDSVSAGKPIDKDAFLVPITLNLKTEGTFKNVFHMLELLEAFPKVLTIERTRLTQHPTNLQWTGTYQLIVIQAQGPEDE